jgi:hypothetical protein
MGALSFIPARQRSASQHGAASDHDDTTTPERHVETFLGQLGDRSACA